MLATWKSATAANRYRGASRFFAYLVEAGELKQSPMALDVYTWLTDFRIYDGGPSSGLGGGRTSSADRRSDQ